MFTFHLYQANAILRFYFWRNALILDPGLNLLPSIKEFHIAYILSYIIRICCPEVS